VFSFVDAKFFTAVSNQTEEDRVRHVSLLLFVMVVYSSALVGQTPYQNHRAAIATAIERRVQTQQPLELSADSIILTGRVLHLKGHAHIVWLPDTSITVAEVKIDGSRVELIGDLHAALGASSGVDLPTPPQIQFR
jgi:hypothetical protein